MSLRFRSASVALASLSIFGGCAGSPLAGGTAAIPHAAPASSNTARSSPGDSFTYAGKAIVDAGLGFQQKAVLQTVTVTSSPDPYAYQAGALDYHSVETDRSAGVTTTWSGDAWRGYGLPVNGVAPFLLYAQRSNDAQGDAFTFQYPVPLVLDRRPERNGATWSNGAAAIATETQPNATAARAQYAADGTYTERVRYPGSCGYAACTLDVAVTGGGAARYSGSALAPSGLASIALAAPFAGSIAVVYTQLGGAQQRFSVPAWFTATTPLYSENDAVTAGVAFPRACGVPPQFGWMGNLVVRQTARIDPAAGTSETQRIATYTVPAYGTACVVYSDTVQEYYDFTTGALSGTPIATQTTNETVGLRSARTSGAADARVAELESASAALRLHRIVDAFGGHM